MVKLLKITVMKKIFFLFMTLAIALTKGYASVNMMLPGQIIPLQVNWGDETGLGHGDQKSPVLIPTVFLDSHTLYFEEAFGDVVPVELTDASGNVVYSDYLPAGTQTLSLPATLSGAYTLFIYIGNYVFAGQINL